MFRPIRRGVHALIRQAGYELRRPTSIDVAPYRIARMLEQHQVRTVLDVGANEGQYAVDLRNHGYSGDIVSFEALPDAWQALVKRAASAGSNWRVAERCALSDRNGEVLFYEARNRVSSSLLPMANLHLQAAPESQLVASVPVPARRLDDYLSEHKVDSPAFLKLDVQGAELLVLQGAQQALKDIVGVQLELSLCRLYENQPLYWEIDAFLRSHGFECWEILPEFFDPRSLRRLQYDGIYFKSTS